jgi:hypothetical protein
MKFIKVYKNIALACIMISGAFIGYMFLGPFFTSGVIEWFSGQPKIVRELISIESMLIDCLISSCIPMLVFWAIAFYGYNRFSTNIEAMNRVFPLAWLFAESPATVILFLSSLLVGLCGYGWAEYTHSSSLKALTILCSFFIFLGFVVKFSCTQNLKKFNFLNNYSVKIGHICSLFALFTYLWSVLADPINLYFLVKASIQSG